MQEKWHLHDLTLPGNSVHRLKGELLKKKGHAVRLKQRNGCVWKLSKKKHHGVRSLRRLRGAGRGLKKRRRLG